VRNLDSLLAEQEQAAQTLKRNAVDFANLQTEAEKKRETLDALITRQNEMALSTRLKDLSGTSSNIRVVDSAKPPRAPFRPNIKLNLILGVLIGLMLGVALAILLDHLDNTISTADEIQRLTGLPALAVIPRHGDAGSPLARVRRRQTAGANETLDLVAHLDGKAGAAEAYRNLRTSLLLSNPGQPPRTILITSAIPEEGKTATAINLAVVLAQLGARVLLVDTDLRRPRLHKAFGVENRHGVSNCLSGLEDAPARLTLPTGVEGLRLLPSGPIPPNPSELLNSPTFVQLGRQFIDQGYDHIVFDSPPVLSVSDPVIIANAVESCILVARAGRTARQSIRLAVDRLRQAAESSLGVVLNDLDPGAPGSSHYGYAYYGHHADTETDKTGRGKAGGASGA
jgi:capsular exopolysaccharide synthesis family protein